MDNRELTEANQNIPCPDKLILLIDNIFYWGIQRNITREGGATALSQLGKIKEEIKELEEGLIEGDNEKILDGIGDVFVVLMQVCRLTGCGFTQSLEKAWKEIKDRKGRMENGVFVKEK